MNTENILEKITAKFDDSRIVFWYDEDKKFETSLSELNLDDVQVINLSIIPAFEAKYIAEYQNPDSKFLFYAPFPKPAYSDDVLLDIYLYSAHFYADLGEMVRDELGLNDLGLRTFIQERQTFFTQARKNKLKPLLDGSENESALAVKMIQVLLSARSSACSEFLLSLFHSVEQQDSFNPKELSDLEKFKLDTYFWNLVEQEFGFEQTSRNVQKLGFSLFATEINLLLGNHSPSAIKSLAEKSAHKASHTSVMLTTWRDSGDYKSSYFWHIKRINEEFKLQLLLADVPVLQLVKVNTSEVIDSLLLTKLRELLSEDLTKNAIEEIESVITIRRTSYWCRQREDFRSAYQAMYAIFNFIRLKDSYPNGFQVFDAKSFVDLYTKELYRFDELYRQYHQCLAVPGVAGTLTALTTQLEALYSGWYLPTVASTWTPFIENSLLKEWEIPGIINQYEFFKRIVRPLLNSNPKPRVAVLISDALRYEAGRELAMQLNKRDNIQAEVELMLSVLPSHTALGMAALLPHESIDYEQSVVKIDGFSSSGLDARTQILAKHSAVAFKAEEIRDEPREKLREKIGESQLIYVYHNKIDATGDDQKTEKETFHAVEDTLVELDVLTAKILNNLNCSAVLVTADHGFIYSAAELAESERSELEIISGDMLVENKRYVVGKNLQTKSKCWKTNTVITAKTKSEYDVLLPRGVNRFHFKGGARYFHGGAMPQEVLVPVIVSRRRRDKAAEGTKALKVDVIPLSVITTITSPRQTIKFIQTDLTSEKLLAREVVVGFYDSENQPVSDTHQLRFDASADNQATREQAVTFAFKSLNFNQTQDYYLRILEQGTDRELVKQAVKIKILIADEFS